MSGQARAKRQRSAGLESSESVLQYGVWDCRVETMSPAVGFVRTEAQLAATLGLCTAQRSGFPV